MAYRVVLALNRKEDLNKTAAALQEAGFTDLTRVTNTLELILTCTSSQTDILIIDMEFPFMDCMSAVNYLSEQKKVQLVIAVADDWACQRQENLTAIDLFVTREVTAEKLIPGLIVNLARKEKLRKLEEEYDREAEDFRQKKILHYTLHLLMDKMGCSEAEGMAYLKKHASSYGKEVSEVAEIFYAMMCMEKKSTDRKE